MKTAIDEKTDLPNNLFIFNFSNCQQKEIQNVGTCQSPHSNAKFETAISEWIQQLNIKLFYFIF